MKRISCIMVFISLFSILAACNNSNSQRNAVSEEDSIAMNNGLPIMSVDTLKVSDALRNSILINDLDLLKPDQRKYSLDEFDLNGDGKVEYFVGFANDFFCVDDGCTYLILNNDGSLNSRLTVTYGPFTILSSKTNGWYDILVNSNFNDHILKFDGKSYPAHPWTLPVADRDSLIKNNQFLEIILEGEADYTF